MIVRMRMKGKWNITNGMIVGAMPEYSNYWPIICGRYIDQCNARIL